jgi:hypothetical protein
MLNAANFIVAAQKVTPTSDYCVPNIMQTTWGADAMREQLIELRMPFARNSKISKKKLDTKSSLVFVLAPALEKKTHAIVKAPGWLNGKGIYTTYNLKQQLVKDNQHPRKALLIRLILLWQALPHAAVTSSWQLTLPILFLKTMSPSSCCGNCSFTVRRIIRPPRIWLWR